MLFAPIQYNEPVFRPPGEANSVIVQATLGCSWNQCAFCEMYTSKNFKVRNTKEVLDEINTLGTYYAGAKKIFLADGNAFVLSASKLMPLLKQVNSSFGRIQRIAAYASPKDIAAKTHDELFELRALGLKLLYIGIESGDNELLECINKGETSRTIIEGINKAHQAGIDTSIMIINGLGGKNYSKQHALNSAKIINEVKPKLLSTLTLSLPYGMEHFRKRFKGEYKQQTVVELFEELYHFIDNIAANNIIYRSDHVSNNLMLKGVLSKDKDKLLQSIDQAIANTPANEYPLTSPML